MARAAVVTEALPSGLRGPCLLGLVAHLLDAQLRQPARKNHTPLIRELNRDPGLLQVLLKVLFQPWYTVLLLQWPRCSFFRH